MIFIDPFTVFFSDVNLVQNHNLLIDDGKFDIPLVLYFMRFLGFECMVDMMKENSTGIRKRRSSSSLVNKDRVSEFRNSNLETLIQKHFIVGIQKLEKKIYNYNIYYKSPISSCMQSGSPCMSGKKSQKIPRDLLPGLNNAQNLEEFKLFKV